MRSEVEEGKGVRGGGLAGIGGQWSGVSSAVVGGDSGRRVSVGGGWTVLGRKVWAAEQGTV